ncbi:phosphotransferase enzyme family protein [Mycobacterium xenopi 4042]|uniref:Phosphotransferase enzyme family protein n=1 Tax=Mycobacterium xenopi 4042 TaxID=1299334 RepID=X8EXV1_MYCXE|nr:phosphotransferase enzyme family protein [Mycobacterium xenopi 4042]
MCASGVGPNDHGLSLDLRLRGQFPVYEQTPAFHRSRAGSSRTHAASIRMANWKAGSKSATSASTSIRSAGGSAAITRGVCATARAAAAYRKAPNCSRRDSDGVLYYMGIFQFDDELVHFAQRETSAGERWQFEGELLYPIDSGHEPGKIIDVEHDLKFRDELRVIRSGTFTIHRGDRSTSTIDVTPLCDFWPGLAGYMEVNGYASGYWRGTDFIDGYTVDTGDLAVIRPVSMLSETLCEVRMDGKVGHGLVEMVFMGAYPVTGTRVGNRGAVDRRRTTAGAGTRCAKDDSRRRLGTHRQLATSRGRLFHRDIPVRRCRIERSVECWPGVSPSSRPRDTSRLRPAPTVPDHAATGRLTVPVPTVRWIDADGTALGTPYFVMDRIDDVVTVSDVPPYQQAGIFADTDDEGRAALWNGCLDIIAKVHAIDPDRYRLGFLALSQFGSTPPQRLANFLRYALNWASGDAPLHPVFTRALDWLDAHLYTRSGSRCAGAIVGCPMCSTVATSRRSPRSTGRSPMWEIPPATSRGC